MDELLQILPLIIRLFPELVKTPLIGKIIPLFNVSPENDAEVLRKLNEKIQRDLQNQPRDKSHVIKVSDALTCVNTQISGRLLSSVLSGILAVLRGQGNIPTSLFSPIAKCMREKELSQQTPRSSKRKTRHGRPARGHGTGRNLT